MELYLSVCLVVSEGMCRRQAEKHFNISRDRMAKIAAYSTPPGYQWRTPIEHWLDDDLKMPRKPRHTAKRVFDQLRDKCGLTGGYAIIMDNMGEWNPRR
ncbi:transposase [Ochrobactrum sp. 19YEA23]|nr:transposase [Ochrobactrum sp. 19YEA23]